MNTDLLRAILHPDTLVDIKGKDGFDLVEDQKDPEGGPKDRKIVMKVGFKKEAEVRLVFKIDRRAPNFLGDNPADYAELQGLKLRSCCDFALLLLCDDSWEVMLVEMVSKVPGRHGKLRAKVEQLILGRFAVRYLLDYVAQFARVELPDVNFSYTLLHTDGRNVHKNLWGIDREQSDKSHPRALLSIAGKIGQHNNFCIYGLRGKHVKVMMREVAENDSLRATDLLKEYRTIQEKGHEGHLGFQESTPQTTRCLNPRDQVDGD